MRALARACAAQAWSARIACVVSNRPDAPGLEHARAMGLVTACLDHREYAERAEFDKALRAVIDAWQPDIVALAGFMRVLGAPLVEHYAGRLVNIHPSLLPSFPGLNTHRRALHAGVRVHGATVHYVSADVDHGPIIAQATVPVLAGDDVERLSQRVLAAEHELYPMVLHWLVEERVALSGGQIVWRGAEPPRLLHAQDPSAPYASILVPLDLEQL